MASTVSQRAALALTLPVDTVRRIARSAPHRYKVYSIPKRSGEGLRQIAQPAREVKALQRWLVNEEINLLPVHPAATAYQPGSSIRENAQRHVAGNYLLKADFQNFFPSIRERDVRSHVVRHFADRYSALEVDFICRVALWRPEPSSELQLSIGAPSSPFISNSMMFEFDERVDAFCIERHVTYSRYADDLTFSTRVPNVLELIPPMLRQVLRNLEYPSIYLNERKFVSTSKKHFRTVTGLVLSSQGQLSLGREKKRVLRAMVYRFTQGILSPPECLRLRGLIAFAEDVEPTFVRRLEARYSLDVLREVRSYEPPRAQ